MKISIEYESSWRNSFLEGSNGEPLPKTGRKFIGSMTSLKKPENFIKRDVTLDTVMGLLNRLIGDQRKLYQARTEQNYYFEDIEPQVTFQDQPKFVNNEMTYIRNITGSTDQNAFSGVIKVNDPMLTSDFSKQLWGVLGLSLDEVCCFIKNESYSVNTDISLSPTELVELADTLDKKAKPVENLGVYEEVVHLLNNYFSELITEKLSSPYVEKSGKIKPVRFYAAALYIQLERLNRKFDMSKAKTKSGKVAGFSKRGFNGKRDFMKNFVTGGEKKIWGNPYIHEEFVKGEGKTKHLMTKTSGTLEVVINVSREKAKQIKQMIDDAGVSSFYLGKKGLAYVTNISTKEVR
ncbi:type I-Fv CRISPR-associated protein Cas5fv [Pseudoalteromonas denitrificans]|uniref:Cas5fv helical domain-containing protein n=1 Tax=Pseudoalteromonas denitrificans DSM 6059 TaxID=1123010 RepID=A0A1I1U0C9_9GAMM|nr:type I-Fv CRISPR-associated protein Cas5fv [Pseudoalteromonas denitrificans]SFD62153.1 hypothetical protein SAMN02745724_05003 [Pseudoalteromonas denitrificans DSM 6059]